MAKKKKTGSIIYGICLSIYILALAAAIIFGLTKVWAYAVEYENADPTRIIDAYVNDLKENLWGDSIADTISKMPHEMQTNEECAVIVKEMLANELTYSRMPKENSTDPYIRYKLRCAGNDFGVITLAEDQSKANEVQFGMLPWKVEKEEFDFTGLYSSVEVVVPSTYSVELNGTKLGEEYIVESGIEFDNLEGYYNRYPNLPTKVKYKFDNIIGHLDPVILDESGNVTTINPDKDDSQYMTKVSEDEMDRLNQFTQEFITRYKKYISGQHGPEYGYQLLQPYMKKGSEIDESMKGAQDGIGWVNQHPPLLEINSITLNTATYIGDGIYFLDVTSDSTTTKGNDPDHRVENMRIIVTETANEIRAVALDIY